ncbi:hypothetical protein AB0948_19035 [Streptomyces koyangensis]|uniref:hypothetical protein n=1 Tax=Streptomyces koyangensis TaxID=188770 RepID=UPI0034534E89
MFGGRRRRQALRRVEPGDGRALKRFRWWQLPFRALLHLRLTEADGTVAVYSVDVRHGQNQSSGEVRADLYREGLRQARCRLPAVLPVPGGHVEVAMSGFGLKRCHYVTDGGSEYQLTPDPASAEGRRARFDRAHPALSRGVGWLSAAVLGWRWSSCSSRPPGRCRRRSRSPATPAPSPPRCGWTGGARPRWP